MKLCTFRPLRGPTQISWPGLIRAETVVRLEVPSMRDYLAAPATTPLGPEFPLTDIRLLAPIPDPPSVRDFFAFEQHVATTRRRRGLPVPPEWYELPVFYFSNPAAITGPDEDIPYPAGTQRLDYELEVAAVIGAAGEIGGFTIMNDWSARDIQAREMAVGLGPSKGKDFATSLGPIVVTPDEFDGSDAVMTARVNGVERSSGRLSDMHFSWAAMAAHAARNTTLRPGDVLGSGTVGSGCILEHGDGNWLRPGDVVELDVEGLGILRNRVGWAGSTENSRVSLIGSTSPDGGQDGRAR
jgi:fumarylacetoacetate (FAA) hydrolase